MIPPRLVVALDLPDAGRAAAVAGLFSGLPVWMKVGLELFTAAGPDAVRAVGRAFPVFLDLKFHDIPNTVRGAVRSAADLGAAMTTLHLEGGEEMCRAAVRGRQEAGSAMSLLGVTLLTSRAPEPGTDPAALVVERALRAREWGLDGVVCSGREAAAVKAACGDDFLCLCPGIRPPGAGADDQARVVTPLEAARAGADFLVMGRPILGAADPREVADDVVQSLQNLLG